MKGLETRRWVQFNLLGPGDKLELLELRFGLRYLYSIFAASRQASSETNLDGVPVVVWDLGTYVEMIL